MSTVRADNFGNRLGTETVGADVVTNGPSKTNIQFSMTINTIQYSYNVSSITDNLVGFFDVNLTNAKQSASYPVVTSSGAIVSTNGVTAVTNTKTSTSFSPATCNVDIGSNNLVDVAQCYAATYGDLA